MRVDKVIDGWTENTLENLTIKITDGSHYSPKEKKDGKFRIATVKNFSEYGFDIENCKRISDEDYEMLVKNDCKPLHNDVLLSKDGTMGITYRQNGDNELVILSSIAIIRPNIKIIDPDYLRYYLKWDNTQDTLIHGFSSGSALPRIVLKDLKLLPVVYPLNIKEQQKIASILGALDDKIELNHQMNRTLEAMAQAIFKSWFVDFEPFQDGEFEYNEELDKEIPKGWEVKRVGEIGEVVTGGTPSTRWPEYYGSDFPFIKIPDMREDVFAVRTESYVSKLGAESKKKKLLPPLSVCISCIATPGLVSLTYATSLTNQQINSIICNKNISPYFTYLMMKNISREIILGGSGGTATLNLNKGDFSRIKVLISDDETMKSFNNLVEPMFNYILENQKEFYDLVAIRDTLLPKLLSGEIRVNADKTGAKDEENS